MKKRHSPEQIVSKLRQADVALGKGFKVPEVCRQLGTAIYNVRTDFTGTGFDPVAAGWTLVPEPTSLWPCLASAACC